MALKHRQLDISDYVTETGPSVPALIVHCVNEVNLYNFKLEPNQSTFN